MTPKRKAVETTILEIMDLQDPSGYNSNVYKDFFKGLDDSAFDQWMKTLRDHKHAKLTFLVIPFKVNVSLTNAFAVAKALGVEIFERLKLWDPVGKRFCLTSEKYMILRLPIRRLRQYLMDGLSVPDNDKNLNPLTDQVSGISKGSAISFPQAQMISEKGLSTTLQELMTIRGGDLEAYSRLKSEIEETGSSDTSVRHGTAGIKSAQTLKTFLSAMHLTTNL